VIARDRGDRVTGNKTFETRRNEESGEEQTFAADCADKTQIGKLAFEFLTSR
jgi:hypothetical protein